VRYCMAIRLHPCMARQVLFIRTPPSPGRPGQFKKFNSFRGRKHTTSAAETRKERSHIQTNRYVCLHPNPSSKGQQRHPGRSFFCQPLALPPKLVPFITTTFHPRSKQPSLNLQRTNQTSVTILTLSHPPTNQITTPAMVAAASSPPAPDPTPPTPRPSRPSPRPNKSRCPSS
jgi:hypothetical protein